jgi:hypothetical protein
MGTGAEDVAELATFLRAWADVELAGYCPLYDRVARALADDEAMLVRIAGMAPREKLVPVLLFAAVKWLAEGDPSSPLARIYSGAPGDPWPAFRAMLDAREDDIARLMRSRRIQTNEVGRAAAVLPALALAHARLGRPLALVELGASAGLNLQLDRFAYEYGSAVAIGDRAAVVRLACEIRGPLRPPLPVVPPPIASRCGIDLDPVDPTDDEQCRWLEACVWPGVPGRAERLRAAVRLARSAPPRVLRGNMLDLLPAVLDGLPGDVAPCIVSTWALAYLSEDERGVLADGLVRAGARRDLACVTAEFPNATPWDVATPRRPSVAEGRIATLLAFSVWADGRQDARALAWMHSHGSWIDWIDDATAA